MYKCHFCEKRVKTFDVKSQVGEKTSDEKEICSDCYDNLILKFHDNSDHNNSSKSLANFQLKNYDSNSVDKILKTSQPNISLFISHEQKEEEFNKELSANGVQIDKQIANKNNTWKLKAVLFVSISILFGIVFSIGSFINNDVIYPSATILGSAIAVSLIGIVPTVIINIIKLVIGRKDTLASFFKRALIFLITIGTVLTLGYISVGFNY